MMGCPIDLSGVYALSVLALGITLIAVGLAYALGQMLRNPRFNVWAKTEVFQVFVTFVLVIVTLFLVDSLCTFQYGALTSLAPISVEAYEHPAISDTDVVADAAGSYLKNLAYFAHIAMGNSRAVYGGLEKALRYSRSPCMPAWLLCMLGPNGYTLAPYRGGSGWIQVANLTLYTDTISYLTVLAQLALLQFILGGGLAVLMPAAIIIRSLPFMRIFGGGMLAICISLLIVYPFLLMMESLFWNPYEMIGQENFDGLEGLAGKARDASHSDDLTLYSGGDGYSKLQRYFDQVFLGSSATFMSSTFLFMLNVLVITASAREFGRVLGVEVDMSRLMQIV